MSFKSGNKALIHFLFENGADLNVVNEDNMTPICFGSYRLLNELNLLNGFAVLNQEVATREMEKRAHRAESIMALKKHSDTLDQRIREILAKAEKKARAPVAVQIISDEESDERDKPDKPCQAKKPKKSRKACKSGLQLPHPKKLNNAKSLLEGKKSGFFKCLKKRMSVQKQSNMFQSNDINQRLRKGQSTQAKSSSKTSHRKSHNAGDRKKHKKRSKRTVTLREIKFNRLMKEKRQQARSELEFTNNFMVDTCGSDMFLLKKLPQLYDPHQENDIVHQFRSLERDPLTKNPTIQSVNRSLRWSPCNARSSKNQRLVNLALQTTRLTNNNRIVFRKKKREEYRELIELKSPMRPRGVYPQ